MFKKENSGAAKRDGRTYTQVLFYKHQCTKLGRG